MHSCDRCQGNEGEVFWIVRLSIPDGPRVLTCDLCEGCLAELEKAKTDAELAWLKKELKSCGKPS